MNIKKFKKHFVAFFTSAIFCVLLNSYLYGGIQISFEKLTLENGLAQNSCRAMIQDNQGFMWFGTEDGLHKYDGYEFTIYQFDPYDPNSLSNNSVRVVHENVLYKGRYLWIGTNGGGLNKLDRFTGKFIRYQHVPNDSQSLSSDYITCIHQDDSGNLWIGTDGGGLNKMDPATGKCSRCEDIVK